MLSCSDILCFTETNTESTDNTTQVERFLFDAKLRHDFFFPQDLACDERILKTVLVVYKEIVNMHTDFIRLNSVGYFR